MELVVLGCSGSLAGPDAPASGYLVRNPAGDDLVMDVGPGVLAAMQRTEGVDPAACHVAFSHMHADHCLDFPSLLVWRRYHPIVPARRVHRMLGPRIAFDHLSHVSGDHPSRPDDFSDTFSVSAFSAGSGPFSSDAYPCELVDGLRVYAAEAVHPTEAYVLRVEDEAGKSVVYSGDTAWTQNLPDIAAGADVFLCEATWGAGTKPMPPGMHISGVEAGRAAALAGVKCLVLTHIPPWGDVEATRAAAAAEFDGEIIVATPGLTLSF